MFKFISNLLKRPDERVSITTNVPMVIAPEPKVIYKTVKVVEKVTETVVEKMPTVRELLESAQRKIAMNNGIESAIYELKGNKDMRDNEFLGKRTNLVKGIQDLTEYEQMALDAYKYRTR